jgi:hypothetical protein
MAQTGFTPISNYYSATATNVPTAGNLVAGELAINTADGKLFYKDSSGVVQTMASKDATAGTYSSITTSNLTIGTTQLGAGNASIMKNRIINGAMVIDQRNDGASVSIPSTATYTLDRYGTVASQSSKFSVQQNAGSVTPPVGFSNYLGVTSSSAYSVPNNEIFTLYQNIEGFNTADLMWGTANAKTITISFWVRSSLTGTFGGSVANNAFDRSYPYSYTISAANTWEFKSITIAGDTTGTWVGATNGIGMRVYFPIGVGSDFSGTAGAWAGAGDISATGATSVVGTSGATFYITGVQLEVGSSATGYEYRQYTTELELCERYFWKTSGALGLPSIGAGFALSTTDARVNIQHPVSMRSTPTYAYSGTLYILASDGNGRVVTGIPATYPGYLSSMVQFGASSAGLVAGNGTLVICDNASSNFFTASAEL